MDLLNFVTFDEHFLFSSTTRFHSDLLRLTFFHSLQTWATTRSESTSRKRNIFCRACLRFLVSSRLLVVGALISKQLPGKCKTCKVSTSVAYYLTQGKSK